MDEPSSFTLHEGPVDKLHAGSKASQGEKAAGPSAERVVNHDAGLRTSQQALLLEVNSALAGAIDAELVLGPILSRLRERTRLTNASIYLLDSDKRLLRRAAESGHLTSDEFRELALDGSGLGAWAARNAEAVYVPDVLSDPRYLCGDSRIRSEYAVPLLGGAGVLGVLDIQSDQLDGIRAVTVKLVDQFAVQAALAIERSELYRKLRASEECFRSLFEQGPFAAALCTLDGEFSTVNVAFARSLGYGPEELRGRHDWELTHPDDRKRSAESMKSLAAGYEDRAVLEKRYLRKSGEVVWGRAVISVIRDSGGRPTYALSMVQDITEQKKAEEERTSLQERLLQAQKMEAIGTLAGGLAHDFNNFLGVIMGFASLVRLHLRPEDLLQEPVRMIEQSAESAAEITRELLSLTRHEIQSLEPVSVGEILDRVMKLVARTFDRRIQVEMRLVPELPWVIADSNRLEPAVLNLCINARDAMPEGGKLTVETSRETLGPGDALRPTHCPPGEYVRIAVGDTGEGIQPELTKRIFEPFFTTKEAGQGSGLGLSMVSDTVTSFGGFVHVESEVGRGSVFSIYLPPAAGPRQVAPPPGKQPVNVEYGSGTVLVVDDEPLVCAFAEEGLKRLGYKVVTAQSGTEAAEIYASRIGEIDYVLLDIIMPGISGAETCQRLRAINPRVKVILSSGYSQGRAARDALKTGANEFLGKPYTLEMLSLTLKRLRQD